MEVSRIALGGNMFGSVLSEWESFAVLDAYVELGGNLIDTAAVYADWIPGVERGASERLLGRWLRRRGSAGMVVATKGGHPALDDPAARARLDERSLRDDIETSLDRLGIGVLPLWLLHRDDRSRPVDELAGLLDSFVAEGLLAAYGVSNWSVPRLAELVALRATGHAGGLAATSSALAVVRPRDGALAEDLVVADRDMLGLHEGCGLTLLAYSAQAKGFLDKSGAAQIPTAAPVAAYDTAANRELAGRARALAARLGVSATSIGLAACLRLVPYAVAIVGCRTPDQLRDAAGALHLDLSESELVELNSWIPTTPS